MMDSSTTGANMLFSKYRKNYTPEKQIPKSQAIAFWVACAGGFVTACVDLFLK